MRAKYLYYFLALFFTLYSLSGCVSVQLPEDKAQPAVGFEYGQLPNSFREVSSLEGQKSWRNQQTGNSISIFSQCHLPYNNSLEHTVRENLQQFESAKVLSKQFVKIDQRRALSATLMGYVDGVKIKMNLITYKKNSCHYQLSYIATSPSYDKDLAVFKNFSKGFRAR